MFLDLLTRQMLGRSLPDGNKDHLLNQARRETMKQEHQVESLNSCISELQQQAYAQRLELEDAHHGYNESRREQSRLEEFSMKEKALREAQIQNILEMGEMKRAHELRVDEFFVQKSRESHETIQRLTSQLQEMQEQMNSMNDSGEFQEVESNHSGRLCYVPSQPARLPSSRSMLGCDKRMPLDTWNMSGPQENVFGESFSTFDSTRNLCQGIHHSTTPGDAGSVPVHIGTETLVAREEDRIRGTIPKSTFARRPSTMSSLIPVDIPQNSLFGQQRQQISELQFDKFPTRSRIFCWKMRFQKKKKQIREPASFQPFQTILSCAFHDVEPIEQTSNKSGANQVSNCSLSSDHPSTARPPAGSSGRQSSVDTWEQAKPKGKWIEVSADYEVLDALVKEKKITWSKSGRESGKREADVSKTLEKTAADEKKEERDRAKLGDKLEAFFKRKEEDEAMCFMEEVRKNVEAAQHKSFEAEQSLCSALREYVDSYDEDQGRARTLMTRCWQSVHSHEIKNLHLDKDLEDVQSTARRRVGWSEEEKTARLWKHLEGDNP